MEIAKIISIIGMLIAVFAFGISLTGNLYKQNIKRCIEQKMELELCSKLYGWNE